MSVCVLIVVVFVHPGSLYYERGQRQPPMRRTTFTHKTDRTGSHILVKLGKVTKSHLRAALLSGVNFGPHLRLLVR